MPVLVEALSILLKAASIEARYTGGVADFAVFCRRINNTFCSDGELVRVGFTQLHEAKRFAEKMVFAGLVHLRGGQAIDLVMADQRDGLASRCDWARLGSETPPDAPDRLVTGARLVGGAAQKLAVPEGWRYATSIAARVAAERPPPSPRGLAPAPGSDAALLHRLGLRPKGK